MTATRVLPSSVQAPSGRSWSALIVLMFGTFMFILDFFIVNVALPSIQQGSTAFLMIHEADLSVAFAALLTCFHISSGIFTERTFSGIFIPGMEWFLLNHSPPS